MPAHFLPRKSGPHRIACIALYRALLKECALVPLPPSLPSQGAVNPIKHLVRKGFRRYVDCTSPRILREVLRGGYEAEELLRTASPPLSSPDSLSQIHASLLALHEQRVLARATCLKPPPPSSNAKNPRPRVWPYPGAPNLLATRPLPAEKLSGKRSIPHLAAANGVPFLRVKKPQSAFLGRVLRDKAGQKARRFDRLKEMEEGVDAGGAEEEWEGLVEGEFGRGVVDFGGGGSLGGGFGGREDWTSDVETVKKERYGVMMGEQRKWVEMGRRMMGVVEEEKVLAGREREERKERKWEEKRVRMGWPEKEIKSVSQKERNDGFGREKSEGTVTYRPL